MHRRSFPFLFVLFTFLTAPLPAQVTQAPPTQADATQDPQAVSVLNEAIAAAGGSQAIATIVDYTATGNITYHWDQDVQGTVDLMGLGLQQFRLDANLPTGQRSSAINGGLTTTKTEDGTVSQFPPTDSPVPSSDAFPYQASVSPASLVIPQLEIANAVGNPEYSVSFEGTVQIDGTSAYDIEVALTPNPGEPTNNSQYRVKHFFIDSSTFQVVMTQDLVPKNIIHQVRYSGFTAVGGISVPFSISETMGGQNTWAIQLNNIGFNSGLQDAEFQL